MFHFYLTTSTPTPITNYIAFFLIIKQLISFPVDAFLTEILPLAPVDSNTLAKHLSQYINITFPVVLFARAYFIYDFYTQDISHGQETLVENSKWDNLSRGGRDTLGQIRGEDNWDTSLGHLSGTPGGQRERQETALSSTRSHRRYISHCCLLRIRLHSQFAVFTTFAFAVWAAASIGNVKVNWPCHIFISFHVLSLNHYCTKCFAQSGGGRVMWVMSER